jgi:hypothetical protein
MKAKLFAFLLLFFALSLAAWSYAPESRVDEPPVQAQETSFELPSCAARDRGDVGSSTAHPVKTSALTPNENPLNTAFIELNCLLASN